MKPEVIRPHRISPGRVLVALVIAWCGWYASRVLTALERAHEPAPIIRGPACTTTTYYPPNCPHGAYMVGDGVTSTWWCRP